MFGFLYCFYFAEASDVRPWVLKTSVVFDIWLDNVSFIHTFELAVFNLSICNPFHYKRHLMTSAFLMRIMSVYASAVLCLCMKTLRN